MRSVLVLLRLVSNLIFSAVVCIHARPVFAQSLPSVLYFEFHEKLKAVSHQTFYKFDCFSSKCTLRSLLLRRWQSSGKEVCQIIYRSILENQVPQRFGGGIKIKSRFSDDPAGFYDEYTILGNTMTRLRTPVNPIGKAQGLFPRLDRMKHHKDVSTFGFDVQGCDKIVVGAF